MEECIRGGNSVKSFTTSLSESLLYLKDCGRIKFVQNTWAGVDSLIKKVSGRVRDIKHGTISNMLFAEVYTISVKNRM